MSNSSYKYCYILLSNFPRTCSENHLLLAYWHGLACISLFLRQFPISWCIRFDCQCQAPELTHFIYSYILFYYSQHFIFFFCWKCLFFWLPVLSVKPWLPCGTSSLSSSSNTQDTLLSPPSHVHSRLNFWCKTCFFLLKIRLTKGSGLQNILYSEH